MSSTAITEKEVKEAIKGKLSRYFGVSPTEATEEQMYKAVVMSVRDILLEKRQQFHKKVKAKRAKRVYYLCMEFLLGRSLKNSIYNLSATDVYKKVVSRQRRPRQACRVLHGRARNGKLSRDGIFSPL